MRMEADGRGRCEASETSFAFSAQPVPPVEKVYSHCSRDKEDERETEEKKKGKDNTLQV